MDKLSNNLSHRILIIDDNVSIHEDFRKILMSKNLVDSELDDMESMLFDSEPQKSFYLSPFEIDCASQGRDGLAMVQRAMANGHPYSMAFVDVRMPPGWDGIETIGYLWQACPDLQVVLCTAYADYSWPKIQEILGVSNSLLILKKPFENVEVLQMAYALSRKWELDRELRKRIDNLGQTVKKTTEEKEHVCAKLEAAFKHSTSGIIILDANDNNIFWSNPATAAICDPARMFRTGSKNNDQTDAQVCRDDGTPYSHEELPLIRSIKNGEIIKNEELRICNSRAGDKWISVNAAPIYASDGTVSAGIAIYDDMTQKKKLEENLKHAEKMEALGIFARDIAHDLNNIMGIIIGYSELLLYRNKDENNLATSYMQKIFEAGKKADTIIQDMLTMARKEVQSHAEIDLNEVINNILKMPENDNLRDYYPSVRFVINLAKESLPIRGSYNRLSKIIVNLMKYAVETMPNGGNLTIETFCRYLDRPIHGYDEIKKSEYVALSLSNTGSSIKTSDLNHIFEPFYTRKIMGKNGTGLELSAVWSVIQDHNGYIDVQSEVGKGNIFTLYFPKYLKKITVNSSDMANKSCSHSILIVDDNEEQRFIMSEMLQRMNYSVSVASSGEDAVKFMTNRKVDLVMLDMIMNPGIDGLETYQRILKIHPNQQAIIVTGFAETDRVRACLALGAGNIISKPFTYDELQIAVDTELNRFAQKAAKNELDSVSNPKCKYADNSK